jgi:hypothetical protein
MSGRGGIYEGPGGQELYGDGREVNPTSMPEGYCYEHHWYSPCIFCTHDEDGKEPQ